MLNGIIRLEDMPSTIAVSELPSKIIVPNPGDRKVVITPEESGINEEQVFTSDCLPDEIPYKLIGAVRYPGSIRYYPRYVANVVTLQKLKLGLIKKQEMEKQIDEIVEALTFQTNVLVAEGIKVTDFNFLENYRLKNYDMYWPVDNLTHLGIGAIKGLGVRPAMVVSSEIIDVIPLVEL